MNILLPQFLTDSLVNIILLKVCHFSIFLGTLSTCVRDDCWHISVRESCRCLGHYGCLTAIVKGFPKTPFQILHPPGKLVQGSNPKV